MRSFSHLVAIESETRPNKRRRVIRLHDSSSETPSSESSYPSSISSSVSLKRKTSSLFEEKAPQKRRPKEIDAINSEYLLEVDYPLYIQEEDLWFLYEPPAFAAVSNQLPRSRIFQVSSSPFSPSLPHCCLLLCPVFCPQSPSNSLIFLHVSKPPNLHSRHSFPPLSHPKIM